MTAEKPNILQNCFERVIDLLGRHQADPALHQFICDLGEDPKVYDNGAVIEYMFPRSGLYFGCWVRPALGFGDVYFQAVEGDKCGSAYGATSSVESNSATTAIPLKTNSSVAPSAIN